MRQNILKLIGEAKDVTNVIILTHNIDFIFLQSVVVPLLRKCDHPTLTVFADADCALESFKLHGQWIDGIGRRYRVVPVAMNHGFRFHPKAILLSSQEKATLLVGSGNLGFGGWRENGEVWVRFDTDIDGGAPFAAFHQYLNQIIQRVPLNDSVISELEEAFDAGTRSWATDLNEPDFLLGKVGQGKPLMDQFLEMVSQDSVEQLTICTPYFDTNGAMLRQLAKRTRAMRTRVFVQGGRTGLLKDAVALMTSDITILSVDFRRDQERSSFLHAKFYAFERPENVTVLVGSANCSRAALAIPGSGGNAELMAIQKMTPAEFQENYLNELDFPQKAPQFQEEPDKPTEGSSIPEIRILAARFEPGELRLGYNCSENVKITACLVDGERVEFTALGDRQISVRLEHQPKRVVLEGTNGEISMQSVASWIDYELDLWSSSRERALADAIHHRVRSTEWNATAWIDILELLQQNLQYMPPPKAFWAKTTNQYRSEGGKAVYSEEDVFASGYGLPPGKAYLLQGADWRLRGLQQMLLRCFGIGWRYEEAVEEPPGEVNSDQHDSYEVEQGEELPQQKEKAGATKSDKAERRRAKRVINKVIETVINPEFLKKRLPEQLGIDLAVISILLQSGLAEGWIDYEDFLNLTHRVWSVLFFSSDAESKPRQEYIGCLQHLYKTSNNPEHFVQQLTSVDLSVALASWALAIQKSTESPEYTLFALACAESIAKLPWLWDAYRLEDIANGLKKALIHTGAMEPDDDEAWTRFRSRWKELIQRGYALMKLEQNLAGLRLVEVKELVSKDRVEQGELLWQGTIGLCVAGEDCNRSGKRTVDVLCLKSPERYKKFSEDFLVPLNGLLSAEVISPSNNLTEIEKRVLKDFIDELSEGFNRHFDYS